MAIHEVTQPDGYSYRFKRSDADKMQFDSAGLTQEQKELLARWAEESKAKKAQAVEDDGATAPLPKRQPGQPREFYGRNTSWLWNALRVLAKDGWRLGNRKGR